MLAFSLVSQISRLQDAFSIFNEFCFNEASPRNLKRGRRVMQRIPNLGHERLLRSSKLYCSIEDSEYVGIRFVPTLSDDACDIE